MSLLGAYGGQIGVSYKANLYGKDSRHVPAAEQRSVASGALLWSATVEAISQEYVHEMRPLSASITVGPIPEHIKVPTFINGLRHGPSRQVLLRKVPSMMEEEIQIALVEEQSYNSASATAWYKPSAERSDTTPMELGNADVVCYKCGKRGHMMARCYARVPAGVKMPCKRDPFLKSDGKK